MKHSKICNHIMWAIMMIRSTDLRSPYLFPYLSCFCSDAVLQFVMYCVSVYRLKSTGPFPFTHSHKIQHMYHTFEFLWEIIFFRITAPPLTFLKRRQGAKYEVTFFLSVIPTDSQWQNEKLINIKKFSQKVGEVHVLMPIISDHHLINMTQRHHACQLEAPVKVKPIL